MNNEELETCSHIGGLNSVDQFFCSSCGIWLEGWYEVELEDNEEWHYEYAFKYCPNCGKKIV